MPNQRQSLSASLQHPGSVTLRQRQRWLPCQLRDGVHHSRVSREACDVNAHSACRTSSNGAVHLSSASDQLRRANAYNCYRSLRTSDHVGRVSPHQSGLWSKWHPHPALCSTCPEFGCAALSRDHCQSAWPSGILLLSSPPQAFTDPSLLHRSEPLATLRSCIAVSRLPHCPNVAGRCLCSQGRLSMVEFRWHLSALRGVSRLR